MRERYERALRQRAGEELKEARAKFRTNIDANINKTTICESDAKRDAKKIRRDWKAMDLELEGVLNSLLGGRRDLRQRLREPGRERGNARHRAESLLRKIDEAKRMVREARDSECNARSKASRGISEGYCQSGEGYGEVPG